MKLTTILYWLLAAVLIFIQIAFSRVNFFLANINLALIGLVMIVNLGEMRQVLIFLILAGVILDIFSSLPFGVFLLSLFLTSIFLEMLFLNFFTNRSFYALIFLGLIGVALYNLFFAGLAGFLYLVNLSDFAPSFSHWPDLLWQGLSAILILSFCFWLINKKSKAFRPIFIKT